MLMMNRKIGWAVLLSGLALSGCTSLAPTSLSPGHYSTTTGMPLWPAAYVIEEAASTKLGNTAFVSIEKRLAPNPAPYADNKVIKFTSGLKLCQDTFRLPDLGKIRDSMGAGAVLFSRNGTAIDEVEITNLDWRLFVADAFPAGESVAGILPDSSALPVKDYYTSPFYAYYPVVGISYDQAKLFCQWRTKAWAEVPKTGMTGLTWEYRLPTEAEWEEAAQVRSSQPYGTACTELPVRVAGGAAAYLQKRANSSTPVAQIKQDIAAYNKQHPVRSWINYAQAEPYFLRLATPGYVYQGPANDFGLFQMLGNVAEMVEERGVTKGGSYRDGVESCRIKARGHFDRPSPTVGFRTVCIVHRVK